MLVSAEQQSESAVYIHISPSSRTALPALHPTPPGHHRAPSWAPCVTHQLLTSYFTCGSEYVGATLSICSNLHENTIRFNRCTESTCKLKKGYTPVAAFLILEALQRSLSKVPCTMIRFLWSSWTVWKSQGACEVGCSWAVPKLKSVPVFLRSGLVSRQHHGPSIFILLQWQTLERKKKKDIWYQWCDKMLSEAWLLCQ